VLKVILLYVYGSFGCEHVVLLLARLLAEDYVTKRRFTIRWVLLFYRVSFVEFRDLKL
jgi:hypothetical protein